MDEVARVVTESRSQAQSLLLAWPVSQKLVAKGIAVVGRKKVVIGYRPCIQIIDQAKHEITLKLHLVPRVHTLIAIFVVLIKSYPPEGTLEGGEFQACMAAETIFGQEIIIDE